MANINPAFWDKKKVFITGITGFCGSWLAIWLQKMGAEVFGYSLPMDTVPSCWDSCGLYSKIPWMVGDIRETGLLTSTMQDFLPEIVFHLAAQPIVRRSYRNPVATFDINAIGTASVLEAIRHTLSVRSAVIVTSDKVYENIVYTNGHKENDKLGGNDPYSASKVCAELITDAYRESFFSNGSVRIGTARAGNIIGGGDWAEDRLIPDAVAAIQRATTLLVRNPRATRPWQHVIDPLSGYMCLAERLWNDKRWIGPWNFGPAPRAEVPVSQLLELFFQKWGKGDWKEQKSIQNVFEYQHLKLDCMLSETQLGWHQQISLEESVELTVEWYKRYYEGANMLEITHKQLDELGILD